MPGTELNLAFVADQLAELDALMTFFIDCVKSNPSYSDFRREINKQLKEVKITKIIDVESFLKDSSGFVALVKDVNGLNTKPDYYRDDDGLPKLFESQEAVYHYFNDPFLKKFEVVRIIDLNEQNNAKREE